MKITKIEQQDNIFIVTKGPNLLQRIFCLKTKIEKYKDTGKTYHYFDNIRVYVNQEGQVLGFYHKITKAIEEWRRSF